MFLMTSGLRLVRDKALTYLDEVSEFQDTKFRQGTQAIPALSARQWMRCRTIG